MTLDKAIRLARKWSEGGVCTLREDEAEEYHKMCLEALEEMAAETEECEWCEHLQYRLNDYLNQKIPNVPEVTRMEIAAFMTHQLVISYNDSIERYVREQTKAYKDHLSRETDKLRCNIEFDSAIRQALSNTQNGVTY